MLALALPKVWPSASVDDVGTPDSLISQLHVPPACAPVNASRPVLRPTTHDSGSGWLVVPSLYDSFIHYSVPIYYRRTHRAYGSVHGGSSWLR
jgi:hypothetical protein